jgi:hypothetical protein
MDSTSFERAKAIMDTIEGLQHKREAIEYSNLFLCSAEEASVKVYARDINSKPDPVFRAMQQAAFTVIDLEIARLKAEFDNL